MRAPLRGLTVSVAITLLATSAFPFCICVRPKLKASEIRGRVIAIYKSKPDFEEPIPNAVVEILNCSGGDCQTIGHVVTDEGGHFDIKGVRSGNYELSAIANGFQKVVVGLKLNSGSGGKNKEIIMALEPGLDCCAGEAKIRKVKSN